MAEPTPPDECGHPPNRLFSWRASDGALCVVCCECGAVLAGAAPPPTAQDEDDTMEMTDFMCLGKALEIVHDLALQNALDPEDVDEALRGEALQQQMALGTVEDLIVNHFGKD